MKYRDLTHDEWRWLIRWLSVSWKVVRRMCALELSLSLWFLFNMLVVEVVGACQKLI